MFGQQIMQLNLPEELIYMHSPYTLYACDCVAESNLQGARDTLSGILQWYLADVMPVGPTLNDRYQAAKRLPGQHSRFVSMILDNHTLLDRLLSDSTSVTPELRSALISRLVRAVRVLECSEVQNV